MAGDIDDVVGARHDEQIAVVIDIAGIGGLIVAGKLREVGLRNRVRIPQCRQAAGRQGHLTTIEPSVPAFTGCPASSTTSIW